jgi:hypothetical protein
LKLLARHQLSLDLITACYVIRSQLAHANLMSSVEANVNRIRALTAEEARMRAFLAAIESPEHDAEDSAEAAVDKASALRAQVAGDAYGMRRDYVRIRMFGEADLETLRQQIKSVATQRAVCNDLLTAANVTNNITLGDPTVMTLRRAGIVPSSESATE